MAVHRGLGVVTVLCSALIGFAACNTYDDSLLQGFQGSGNGGAGVGGGGNRSGAGGIAASGGSSAQAGVSSLAGMSGRSGSSSIGDAGDAGAGELGGSGGSAGASGSAGNGNTGGAGAGSGGNAGHAGTGGGATGGSATAGTGGSTAGTGGSAGATTGGSGGSPTGTEFIDDFEDQDLVLMPIKKRNGPWYPFNDGTKAGVQAFAIAKLTGTNARAGSTSTAGLHMTASGFTGFGAGFGADFVNMQMLKVAYDVSAYKGIRFFAKIGAGTQTSMKVLFPTTYSDPMGGKCDDTVALMHCNDHLFELVTPLTTAWASYEVDFADLMQQGFGLKQSSLDPTSVYSVQFTMATTAFTADVWFDDIVFVLK